MVRWAGWMLVVAIGCTNKDKDDTPVDTNTGPTTSWECTLAEEQVEFAEQIGCWQDFLKVASEPLDASIPGALSVKTGVDRLDNNALWFQNSEMYPIHWDFAHVHRSGN